MLLGSFHIKWSSLCNPPSQIFIKLGITKDLLLLIIEN